MTTTLTIQDTFEPYYAGRDGMAKKLARKQASKKAEKRFGSKPNRTDIARRRRRRPDRRRAGDALN